MPILVERTDFDPSDGYQYYVCFHRNGTLDESEVHTRVPVEVAVSLAETGDLADLTFEVPKKYRSLEALACVRLHENARYVDPRVFVVFAGTQGDAVMLAAGRLEVDLAGRIIGMEINWSPTSH